MPVKTVFAREFDRALISAALFEVGGEILYAISGAKLLSDLVQLFTVFERTYGKRGAEHIKAVLCRIFGGAFKSQPITDKAPLAALGQILKPTHCGIKALGVVSVDHKPDARRRRKFTNKARFFLGSLAELRLRRNIGIVIQYGDVKIARQVFKAVAAARRTAAVQ